MAATFFSGPDWCKVAVWIQSRFFPLKKVLNTESGDWNFPKSIQYVLSAVRSCKKKVFGFPIMFYFLLNRRKKISFNLCLGVRKSCELRPNYFMAEIRPSPFLRFFVKTYFFPLNELTLSNGHLKRIRFSLLIMT